MPVNPDEILIFKLRGITTGKGTQPKENAPAPAKAPAQTPQQAPVLAAAKPAPARKEKPAAQAPHARPVEAAPEIRVRGKETEESRPFEEERNAEVARLERLAVEQYVRSERVSSQKPAREATNFFSVFAGILFLANAALFGYFIYPQSLFILNYIENTGIMNFFLFWNYEYGISFINSLLMILTAFCGLMMIARIRQSHFVSGIVGASLILSVSYEYLNSNANYLLLVSVTSFICIVALAYSRMSAVTLTEKENLTQDITWPMVETF